jgi:hypothetical protein
MTPYLINPNAWSVTHSSPAQPPATPSTPVHRRVLIHVSSFGLLLRKVPLSAKVLISLILSRSTHIDHVPRRVRDDVVGLPVFLDRGYLASLKLLEPLLLRGVLGGNHLKAGGYEHAPRFVLCTGRRCGGGAPSHQRQQRCGTDHYEEDSFHLVLPIPAIFVLPLRT